MRPPGKMHGGRRKVRMASVEGNRGHPRLVFSGCTSRLIPSAHRVGLEPDCWMLRKTRSSITSSQDLGDDLVAGFEVGHGRKRLDLRVQFLIRVARSVEGAVAPFAGVHQEVEHILAVEGRYAPAQQVEIGLPVLDQREVGATGSARPGSTSMLMRASMSDHRLADRLIN